MKRTTQLRNLIKGGKLLVAPGAFDGLSARLVEKAGFPLIYATGGGIARSMGYPDMGLVTMTEVIGRVKNMVDVTTVPIIADADTGYGNALNLIRAVKEFESAGAAGIHIEDQVTPKKCGHYDGHLLISEEEMIKKIEAAIDARSDPDFLIIARTDAREVEGLNGAIMRGKLYAAAGADMLFVEAPRSEEEIREIASKIETPLLINMFKGGKTPLIPMARLEELGYRVAIVPSSLHLAAIYAMKSLLDVLRLEGTTSRFETMVSFKERDDLVDLGFYRDLENKYLSLEEDTNE
ncbi:MAG: isocitrate lyase [Deltaproteobacteria bacterium RBG_13_53_10]|nr:MAG: isocitrate lyase [Deltaproteobacteria bacterium RBG_13_53_10]